MQIKYVHFSEPNTEKIFDTVNGYRVDTPIMRTLGDVVTQEEYDQRQLRLLKEKVEAGHILRYEIIGA